MSVGRLLSCCCLATLLLTTGTAVAAGPEGALDARAWELVSPVEKNGGEVATPQQAGAGAFAAAASGEAFAFASAASFGDAEGAAPFSQYVASRGAGGWSTENITPAHLAGAYDGNPYLAFSQDLTGALYRNPARCPVGDPCLPGYQLRDNASGALLASPEDPGLFEGASPDLSQIVFRDGADLLLWSPPASELAPLDADQAAAVLAEGRFAFFVEAGHLHRRDTVAGDLIDLTPGGGVAAFLGAALDGSRAYYATVGGQLLLWRDGASTQQIVTGSFADLSPAGAGATADGLRLFFTTAKALVVPDTNKAPDAYEWAVQGAGTCAKAAGCLGLLSSGRLGSASFLGASADGRDAFILTDASLLPGDTGGRDVYDVRAGGGFPEAAQPLLCLGDACQGPAPAPAALQPSTTLFAGRVAGSRSLRPKPRRRCAAKRGAKRRTCLRRERKGGRTR